MSLTPSTMLPLGTKAPDFSLPEVSTGETITLGTFTGKKGLLVMFICRHCPYVIHVQEELGRLGKDFEYSDLGIVAISSNDAQTYPLDRPESLMEMADELGLTYPYLYDETQDIARTYTAACTPDFFLFDEHRQLVYRGQLDDSRPGNGIPVTGKDLRAAIGSLLADQPVSPDQRPSIGCNIKWR